MTKREMPLIAALVLLPWAGLASGAYAQSADGSSLSGAAQIGFRSVDVDGRQEKYREDVNLETGPRLFHFSVEYTPPHALRSTLDKFEIDTHNLGGDPFEVFRVSVKKHGRYRLDYDRRKSDYFYDDVILPPAQADVRLSNGGDYHTFDFDRVRDAGTLQVHLSSAAKLTLGFDRYTKKGRRTTTTDVERDEFELETLVDESMSEYLANLQYSWSKVTVTFEERIRQYDDAVELVLPGCSEGADKESPTTLDYFYLDRPYDLTGFFHTARVIATPNPRLTLRGEANLSDLSLDVSVAERSAGTNYQGDPFSTDASGTAAIQRDLKLFDVDASYLLTDRLALLAGVRRHELGQDGELQETETEKTNGEIASTSADVGLRFQASRTLTLSGGVRHERRDVTWSWSGEADDSPDERDTKATGVFANLAWRASSRFRLRAGYEDSAQDDPFTLASPTGKRTFRVRAQYGKGEGLSLAGSARFDRLENSDSGWRNDQDAANVRLGYRKASFSASVGYSLVAIDRSIDQEVSGIDVLIPVAYDLSATSIDARVLWSFAERWKVGGHARRYESTGSFEVRRDDARVWLESLIGSRYVAHLGVRVVSYDEPIRGLNDYDATILEASLGYRW